MNTAVERRKIVIALGLALGALFLALFARGMGPQAAQAASHREAPLISLDPTADITDFFMFRDYQPGQQDKVALIMDVIPGEEPSSGPNYWNFDPNVLYKFSIDNNGDGKADDVELEFRFRTEPIRGIARQFTLPFSYVGGAGGCRRSRRSTARAQRASVCASATRSRSFAAITARRSPTD